MSGKITLVATPIGNLGDISERALETLRDADLIAAEDTRHSGTLLHRFNIKRPMVSYYQHNEKAQEEHLLRALAEGKNIALVSDAGTPGVSDPGSAILQSAVRAGFEADAVPGACAAIQALVLSGLPTEKFAFEGFLPRGSKLTAYLETIKSERRTMVIYEAPHRIKETLQAAAAVFGGERRAALCRELTKKFQEINRGTLEEISELWREREVMGEFVLVVAGAEPQTETIDPKEVEEHLKRLLKGGMKHKAAAKEVAKQYDLPAGEVYALGLKLKDEI
ncbi:MAG: 16S rRNA (cytidine(1402)-2'-O)-methyltransferase [Bacillota bacterium]|jgi:16S rRNA (cytidine1402-2'-O)-methyltransferase